MPNLLSAITREETVQVSRGHDVRQIEICRSMGFSITSESMILDFGCGEGHRVHQLREQGFAKAFGFNKGNYLGKANPIHLRQDSDLQWFRLTENGIIPWPDNTFDLIISDQVLEHVIEQEQVFREIHRVLKPGGVSIHVFPAKWQLIEPHIFVPLGGIIKSYAYYYVWAVLGVRNSFQSGLPARETARQNIVYARESLNYLSCREYERMLAPIAFRQSWQELAYMQTSYRPKIQRMAAIARTFPFLLRLIRTFVHRVLFFQKAAA